MPIRLLSVLQFGGYISVFKIILFAGGFYAVLPLICWVYQDARAVGTKQGFWTGVVFAAAVAGITLWLVIPVFFIGLLLHVVAVGAAALSYVAHRNARVVEHERVLTAEHIKSLFASKQKRLEALTRLVFVTANNNEVPVPAAKTPDFVGYKAAHEFFSDIIWRRASNVALVPGPQAYRVVYEVDGVLGKGISMPRDQAEHFIRFLKNLGDLDVAERRKPQKGTFRTHKDNETIEWELTTAGSTAGEQVKIRRIEHVQITKLDNLGLMPEQLQQLAALREAKKGIFIVSGTARSGVTTTFYALLRNHDAFINNIHTLERDPPFELPNITQELFTLSDTGTTTYAKRLTAMIRMGPDIVGVSECRDTETAKVICQAAADGKLVYVCLEADSVLRALSHWMQLVTNKAAAVENLIGISNQRLLRVLCEQCKQAYAPNQELLRKFGLAASKVKVLYRAGKVIYDKHGKPHTCEHCQGTGFVGRTGVFEVITLDETLRKKVIDSKSPSEVSSHFRGAKMLYLQEQALRKVMAGTTSINEVVRVFAKAKQQKRNTET